MAVLNLTLMSRDGNANVHIYSLAQYFSVSLHLALTYKNTYALTIICVTAN